MEYFGLRYPGTRVAGLTKAQAFEIETLLTLCENHLIDAALGLSMFKDARSSLIREQMRERSPSAPTKTPGELPVWYRHRLPFFYAHTVLHALDGIMKVLAVIAADHDLPDEVREVNDRSRKISRR